MRPAGGGPGRLPDSPLDPEAFEEARRRALAARCTALRERLARRDPGLVAPLAAMAWAPAGGTGRSEQEVGLTGHLWGEAFRVTWPGVEVSHTAGEQATLREELLWLHYLDRADGSPLSGRAVTLRELGGGGMFYQQAFQSYAGDALARAWGADREGLARRCLETGGWRISGPADLNFEWLALPRVPVCVHYRVPRGQAQPQAAVLFDAVASHYVAVDVAAVLGKGLVDRLVPGTRDQGSSGGPPP